MTAKTIRRLPNGLYQVMRNDGVCLSLPHDVWFDIADEVDTQEWARISKELSENT